MIFFCFRFPVVVFGTPGIIQEYDCDNAIVVYYLNFNVFSSILNVSVLTSKTGLSVS